ncbi:P-loop containing nucleoside triphosphate hydrolase protein [Mycotypha africana]|uniref:P-loop containing nucleoside triphosphate hydrolase protein n=1 Tax=Mycotypha africana TaxID=64632 RepID=UPI002301B5AD|nr:P-loop containing nucleoside triphosphate hydrolase protein [Mycotypha africana]KAI8971970.1 P-loop containing nucleoside triphosphate hydrolase protein [Mycotypha africana]
MTGNSSSTILPVLHTSLVKKRASMLVSSSSSSYLPSPVIKTTISKLIDRVLSLLEMMSDEAFWNNLFGERVLNLLKRYFGSDVVFLGFIVYLAPILGYRLHDWFYYCLAKFKERMYVSIQISKNESGYEAIQQFVASKTSHIRHLRDVEGRCINDDNDDGDMLSPTPPPKIRLYPLDEIEHKIVYKNHTLWVTKKKNGGVTNSASEHYYSNNIKELLGMMNNNPVIQITMRGQDLTLLQSFIQEWIDHHYEKEFGKLTIYQCLPTRYEGFEWRTIGSKELRSLHSVILKEGQKERILKDIMTFRKREHWYAIRGIPYRRGYLLYGPPGTGKTSLVQSVASKINMNVAIISLSGNMDDENFNVLLQEVPRNSILVMEDIDHCVIKAPSYSSDNTRNGTNTENGNSTAKITMSGLLNALDGVAAQEGSMVFMTCNDINRIQPALLRPGRIDMKMELGYADKSQIEQMFWRFMGEDDDLLKLGESVVEDTVEEPNKKKQKKRNKKENSRLNELAKKFTARIPNLYVTPAELQNFFIMNIMDNEQFAIVDEGIANKEEVGENEKVDYSYLLDAIPAFLESVKRDREQAIEHRRGGSSSKNTPLDSVGLAIDPSTTDDVQ